MTRIDKKLPVWDLSHIYPAFKELDAPEKHVELARAFDEQCAELIGDINAHHDDPERLKRCFISALRMFNWLELHRYEFHAHEEIYTFCMDQREKIFRIYDHLRETAGNLPDDVKEHDTAAKWLIANIAHAIPRSQLQRQIMEYAGSHASDINTEAANDIIARVYNVRIGDEWKRARRAQMTPWELFSAPSGLQEDFIPRFLEKDIFRGFHDKIVDVMPALLRRRKSGMREKSYNWREAAHITIDAFADIDSEFGDIARKAFMDRWIHVAPSGNTALTSFTYYHPILAEETDHPYVFLSTKVNPNKTVTLTGLIELTHEMTHVIENYCKMRAQQHKGVEDYVLQETLGKVAELWGIQRLYDQSKDPAERVELAYKLLKRIETVYYPADQAFEYALYKYSENQEAPPLSTARLQEMYRHAVKKYSYYPEDEIDVKRIMELHHIFTDRALYNFSYIPAILGAVQVVEKLKADPGAGEKWARIMRGSPPVTFKAAMEEMGCSADLDIMCENMEIFTDKAWAQLKNALAEERKAVKHPWRQFVKGHPPPSFHHK